jgi:hypothetical protein
VHHEKIKVVVREEMAVLPADRNLDNVVAFEKRDSVGLSSGPQSFSIGNSNTSSVS